MAIKMLDTGETVHQHHASLFDRRLTANVVFVDSYPCYLMGRTDKPLPSTLVDKVREAAQADAQYVMRGHWEFPEGYEFPAYVQAFLDDKMDASMPAGLEFQAQAEEAANE